MTDLNLISIDMSDEELDEYLGVALSNAERVTPGERKKLSGLMKFYAKKKKPFTACVEDNTKRFGKDRAERICAVLKDLIKGTTKWRSTERRKSLSESTQKELFALDIPEGFLHFVDELDDQEFDEILQMEEVALSDDSMSKVMAEVFFAGDPTVTEDGELLWKTVLREGTWKFSPGPGQTPVDKPITIVPTGKSNPGTLTISIEEIAANFDAGAVEHVTVPTSHADKVLDNTGFVKAVKIEKDEQGRTVLKAALDFTEPEVKAKAKNGTIANISAGLLFDYVHKESGKKFDVVMAHAALTNHPWLNGMPPFGVEASEDLRVVAFSEEETITPGTPGGGETVSTTEEEKTTPEPFDFEKAFGMSEDALRSTVERAAKLEDEARKNRIKDKLKEWEEAKKAPALLSEAEKILTSDKGAPVLNLSEDGSDKQLTLSEVVERLVAASPEVNLAEDPIKDKDVSKDAPAADTKDENDLADLTLSERADIWNLVESGKSETDAIAEVRAKRDQK